MTHRPTLSQLTVALAFAWPAHAVSAQPTLPGNETSAMLARAAEPLRLSLSYSMSSPQSQPPLSETPALLGAVSNSATDSPRQLALVPGALLRMERVLAMDARTRMARAMPSADISSPLDPVPGTPTPHAPDLLALPTPGRALQSPWNRGAADLVVGDDFKRALLRYVRLQMPVMPIWQPPGPHAPVTPVVKPGTPLPLPTVPAFVPRTEGENAGSVGASESTARQPYSRSRSERGRGWRLADQAFQAYNRGDYETALQRADAALSVQPGLVRMHQLRVYALQKLGRQEDASLAAKQAIAQGLGTPELEAAEKNWQLASTDTQVSTNARYRKAFPAATLAYQQMAAGKFSEAAANAEIAVRIDPSQGEWSLLWMDALFQQRQYQSVLGAGEQAVRLGAPNQDAIAAAMQIATQSIAQGHAEKAYEAMSKNRAREAVGEAREAVRLAPAVMRHRLLLISALQANQDIAGAEQAASDALEVDNASTTMQLQRAYLRQQLGQGIAAQQDIGVVLVQDWTNEGLKRNARLIGADLALADGHPEKALALLEALPADDAQAQARRETAGALRSLWGRAEVVPVTAYAPLQLCRDTSSGSACEMQPWDAPGTDNPAARAYAAYGQKRYPEAIALARQAVASQADSGGNASLLTTALAAGSAIDQREALERLDIALQAKPLDANLLRQRAYLRLANDEPALALQDFVAARSSGDAPSTNVLDEAYALAAMGDRPTATAILRQAIDDADQGKIALDTQQRFDTRTAIASFSRDWGVTASVGYRGARAGSNGLVGSPVSVPGNAAFSSVEAYWRPAEFLNSSSSTFDIYGRLSNTLYSGTDVTRAQRVVDPCGGSIDVPEARKSGVSGFPTTAGAVGARYTPWTAANLTFGLERQFFLGSASRRGTLNPSSDAVRCLLNQQASAVDFQTGASYGAWQAYVLYGFYEGTGLRIDRKSWFTMESYLQAGYTLLDAPTSYTLRDSTGRVFGQTDGKLKRGQTFAAGEMRVGRSFITEYNDRLVFFPHVSLAADWYSNRNRAMGTPVPGIYDFDLIGGVSDWSAGAGVGVNVRYWLRGDRYNAQRSYVDGSVQYRTRLGGLADRAKGLFLTLSYSY